jgi:hypothetical protein
VGARRSSNRRPRPSSVVRTANIGGLVALAGAAALTAAALVAADGWPQVDSLRVFLLVGFSVIVGLSTAASP